MAYRLDGAEPLSDGMRRIAHEQLTQSIERLQTGTGDRDDDVHSARKAMKRMRGLVRLLRPALGTDIYRRENEVYRDTARRLAQLRDATVLVATLDTLTDGPAAAALRERLAGRRQQAYGNAAAADPMQACAAVLGQADHRVDTWPLHAADATALTGGVLAVYRRGRREFLETRRRPTVEGLHEWRKRVKYLWHHTQVLAGLWPAAMDAWQAELDRLGGLLGDDHDLAILAEVAGREPPGVTAPILEQISGRRQALQQSARVLGARIYAETPKALGRRLAAYWEPWAQERAAGHGPAAAAPDGAGDGEIVADAGCESGEAPVWHDGEQRLYWVDVAPGRLYCYDPVSGTYEQLFEGAAPVGGFTLQADGSLLLFLARGAIAVWRRGEGLRSVIGEFDVERESRFNGAVADPHGRVFCGTLAAPGSRGRLYRLDPDGTLTELLDGVGVLNGMAFSADNRHLYCADAAARAIVRFDYDDDTGELSNRRPFADVSEEAGQVDGLAVDAEGGVWCAIRGDGSLIRYDVSGSLVRRLRSPARQVTGLGFGGSRLDELYATTAGEPQNPTNGATGGCGGGGLLRLRPGVCGLPRFRSRICL